MTEKKDSCCLPPEKKGDGLLKGVLYSLIPHTFCFLFIIASVASLVATTALFKKILVIPYFFTLLVLVSFLLATLSAFIYLKKIDCLCFSGFKRKWKYLITLYSTMVFINLAMFMLVFPALANINTDNMLSNGKSDTDLSIAVAIPCSGHAGLIIDELKKNDWIGQVTFKMPNIFNIRYDSKVASPEEILSLEIFKTYNATLK